MLFAHISSASTVLCGTGAMADMGNTYLLLHCCRAALAFISAVICGAFTACLLGFLIMHSQLINANCTTIEMYEKERMHPWPYNKGWRRNWEEVLGRRWVHRSRACLSTHVVSPQPCCCQLTRCAAAVPTCTVLCVPVFCATWMCHNLKMQMQSWQQLALGIARCVVGLCR